jgi:hypothetical protein
MHLRFTDAELLWRSGTDHDLVHITIGGLLDCERNRAGDRIGLHGELASGRDDWAFTSGFVTPSA